jgi:SEFIR domain
MARDVIPDEGETHDGGLSVPESVPPRVFISYSHDSDEHNNRVLGLADRLRADGVDAMVDQFVQAPEQGWPAWCEEQIDKADFVLMVCTETFLRRVKGDEERGKGHGVLWEARLIRQQLYDAGSVSNKFVPVLFADGESSNVPNLLRGVSIYRVETPGDYEALLRLLTNQPLTPPHPPGPRKLLPPRTRRFADSSRDFAKDDDIRTDAAQRPDVGPVPEINDQPAANSDPKSNKPQAPADSKKGTKWRVNQWLVLVGGFLAALTAILAQIPPVVEAASKACAAVRICWENPCSDITKLTGEEWQKCLQNR